MTPLPAPAVSPVSLKLSTAPFFHRVSDYKRKHSIEGAGTVPQWTAPSLVTCLRDSSTWVLAVSAENTLQTWSRETRGGQCKDPVILRPSEPLPSVPAACGHVQRVTTLESPGHGPLAMASQILLPQLPGPPQGKGFLFLFLPVCLLNLAYFWKLFKKVEKKIESCN